MHIAFIGFGEAARAFVRTLREAEPGLRFSAYDVLLGSADDASMRAAAEAENVELANTPEDAVEEADWVVSAVTAASSFDAARSVAAALRGSRVYLDINSVSAGVKQRTAALIGESGCVYVDMAVMSPVHPRGHRSPVLIAGNLDAALIGRLEELKFDFELVGREPGMAATIKMVRSLFVKGLEAISVQMLMAAERAGCLERVKGSLAESFPQFEWDRFLSYEFERVATHGVRRAAEMRESAVAMEELGFPEGRALAAAIAALQEAVGGLGLKLGKVTDPAQAAKQVSDALSQRE
ncbi:NAD(P)-dependent oxidoreductase [Chelativorans sp. AA-79]|uniref:NAD(P)-dependent oxidoreductase n=1 Tax=Chelativorans sp. AA-79 TaxID=3028735 RepID=UPI0023FA061A|nr:NAD(P)-dependent oxidoreductase [Chelativorans sp. AA-79]WEX10531.1 DUF1932 domain-containing protein [Chelativorans sp. AA-79]